MDDDDSSDSDFDNKRIGIPSTKIQPDDEQYGTRTPNAVINHVEGGSREYRMRTSEPPIGHMDHRAVNAKISPRRGGGNRVGDETTLNYQRENNSASINSGDNTAYPTSNNQSVPGLLSDIQQRHRSP